MEVYLHEVLDISLKNTEINEDYFERLVERADFSYIIEEDFKKLNNNHPIKRNSIKVKIFKTELDKESILDRIQSSIIFLNFSNEDGSMTFLTENKTITLDKKELEKFTKRTNEYIRYIYKEKELAFKKVSNSMAELYLEEMLNLNNLGFYGLNILREMVLKGYLNKDFLSKYNNNCYLFIED
jgi:hypothetical protein